ncbi:MAG: hypothetical protein P1U42_02000 [Phycisphaerales bacterium]|nr:hypothetical protein [Phycisphaerales bacterium]
MPDGVIDQNRNSRNPERQAVMDEALAIVGESPSPSLRSIVCPFCGMITPDTGRCHSCLGRFDPLSRQATQNQMGPWSIRDDRSPHRPGCSYETIKRLVEQGKITQDTIIRGPSTRQFWMLAKHSPGVGHLLGVCHSCHVPVQPDGFACPNCHASFVGERDRQHLGLGPSRPLPGQGLPEVLALRAEPAVQPGLAGAASTTIGVASGNRVQSDENQSNPDNSIDLSAARKAVEESTVRAKRWRAAYESQRRQAWVVLTIAAMITLAALAYAVWGSLSQNPSHSVTQIDLNRDIAEVVLCYNLVIYS